MNLNKPGRDVNSLLDIFDDDNEAALEQYPENRSAELLMHVDLFQIEYPTLRKLVEILRKHRLVSIRQASRIHLAALFSAHKVLQSLLRKHYETEIRMTTEEGLTPLHLASAVGDFVAVEILLNKGSMPLVSDGYGRVPLHYGILADMRVTVLLCAAEPSAVGKTDSTDRTPLNIAMEHGNRPAGEYCAAILRAESDDGSSIDLGTRMTALTLNRKESSVMDKRIRQSALWIPHHIQAPLCTGRLYAPADLRGVCSCNVAYNVHPEVTQNEVFAKRLLSLPDRFVDTPTDTFGEIEFPSNTYVSEYVRISENSELENLTRLIQMVWSVPKPQLVLSFYGDEVQSSVSKESLRKLIWKSSDSTLTWILTDGLQRGISPVISSAIKEYIEAYGSGLVEVIGVVPWRKICGTSGLTSKPNFLGCYPAAYSNAKEHLGPHEPLDDSVTHYLFVDTKNKPCVERTLLFRTKFEKFLRTQAELLDDVDEPQDMNRTKVQMCGILSGGDEATLTAIHSSVQDGMPFVLLKNTGGLADILIDCINDTEVGERNRRKKALTEGSQENESFHLSPANIHQTVVSYWDSLERPEIVILMIQDLLQNVEMLCICDSEEDELDYLVLLLLIGPAQETLDQETELNYSKLEITVALNRSDVARDKVFLPGLKWNDEKLGIYMTTFLLNDNVPFIKLFLEKGFNLKNYLTYATLERLYTYSVHAQTSKKGLENVIKQFMKLPEKISLLLIGKVLTLLLGSHYYPIYLDTQFTKTAEEDENQPLPLCPATHLFVWALLTERKDSAEFLWTQLQEPLGAALMAALLLRRFAHHGESLVTRDEMLEYANSFEDKASGLLTECFSEDPNNAAQALIRERASFGYMSCLMLAADGHSMTFISHRCSEQYLRQVWCGAIDSQTTKFTFVVSMLVGIALPPLVPFTLKFNLKSKRSGSEKDGADEEDVPRNKTPRHGTKIADDGLKIVSSEHPSRRFHDYWKKIYAYYNAPTVRFAYATLSHLVFLCFFTYTLLFSVPRQNSYDLKENMILLFWVMTYFVENVRQGIMSGLSFRAYTKRIWKALELVAIFLYVLGTALHLMLVAETGGRFNAMPIDPVNTVQQTLLRMADVFYGLSLFLFFYRLLEAFTADMSIGPLVIMIQTMLVKDLLPFLALFIVALVSFSILQWIVAFKNTASPFALVNLRTLFDALQMAYFQIVGEYNLDALVGSGEERDSCKEFGVNCRDSMSTWFSPMLLGVFVILTQVLLLNLLIAMFASTYVRIEAASTGHWSLQRYHVICEFVERSPLPPPLIFIWHVYLIVKYAIRKCRGGKSRHLHPFKKSFEGQESRERQLKHWERLRFWDYQRYVLYGRNRQKHQRMKSINVRTTVLAGQGGSMSAQLASNIQTFQQSASENIQAILSKTSRMDELERKLDHVIKALKNLQEEQTEIRKLAQNSGQSAPYPPIAYPVEPPQIRKPMAPVPRFSRRGSFRIPPLMTQDSVTSDITSNMVVIAGLGHRIAFFVPPTADKTPSLFSYPIPWTTDVENQSQSLGWKPQKFCLEDWTESDDVKFALKTRQTHPMGTSYLPRPEYPPPDPVTGAPRNPGGRTGVPGHGYLPFWGANPALILAVTRLASTTKSPRPQLLFAMFAHHIGAQLPWCLVRHSARCPGKECTKNLVDMLVNTRVTECSRANPQKTGEYEKARSCYQKCQFNEKFCGFINDMINTDNAWLEPTVVHLHFDMELPDPSVLLRILVPEDVPLIWSTIEDANALRESHKKICRDIARNLT
ncbi:Transient receptor potential cation channel subfamily M member 2 [Fasciola hepatica]|uniref:Transient receptor potential cation channel subfamily M member 2 n=1 Tax=Fasciola hepatica TaxID=6192 RepID=A0A4E0RJQ9_FASHE|nr:Transient receptor potential cation channel subfamily M member 2 [Fasciola hepatica]